MGTTLAAGSRSPFLVESRSGQQVHTPDGAMDEDGMTLGTYMHGLFHNPIVLRSILEFVATRKGVELPAAGNGIDQNTEYSKLAEVVRQNLDVRLVYREMGLS